MSPPHPRSRSVLRTVVLLAGLILPASAPRSGHAEESVAAICGRMLPRNGAVELSSFNSSKRGTEFSHKISCESEFASSEEALASGLTLGLPIYGVPLKFGLTFDRSKREQWKHDHCTSDERRGTLTEDISSFRQSASRILSDKYVKCVKEVAATLGRGVGVQCGLNEADGAVVVSARFLSDSVRHPAVHISEMQTIGLQCGATWSGGKIKVTPGGIAMLCQRTSRAQAAVLVINTDTSTTCTDRLEACGELGMGPCSPGPACSGGLALLSDETCGNPCGASGQKCCQEGAACSSSDLTCSNNSCQRCGQKAQQCCHGNTCSEGVCVEGTCQDPNRITDIGIHVATADDDKDKSMSERWDVYIGNQHVGLVGPVGTGVRWVDHTDNGTFWIAPEREVYEGANVFVTISQSGGTGWRMEFSDVVVKTVGNKTPHVVLHCGFHRFEGTASTDCGSR